MYRDNIRSQKGQCYRKFILIIAYMYRYKERGAAVFSASLIAIRFFRKKHARVFFFCFTFQLRVKKMIFIECFLASFCSRKSVIIWGFKMKEIYHFIVSSTNLKFCSTFFLFTTKKKFSLHFYRDFHRVSLSKIE